MTEERRSHQVKNRSPITTRSGANIVTVGQIPYGVAEAAYRVQQTLRWPQLSRLTEAMPGYENHKANLAVLGKNVWLGATG